MPCEQPPKLQTTTMQLRMIPASEWSVSSCAINLRGGSGSTSLRNSPGHLLVFRALHQNSLIHMERRVGTLRRQRIMRDHQNCLVVLPREPRQQIQNLICALTVQI